MRPAKDINLKKLVDILLANEYPSDRCSTNEQNAVSISKNKL